MNMKRSSLVIAAAAFGCTPPQREPAAPPSGFEHAYAAPSCAPWDGYAVSIVMRPTPLAPLDSSIETRDVPHLELGIYPRDERGTGRSGIRRGTYRWPADPEVAGGAYCDGGERCTPIRTGRIRVHDVDEDGRLGGTVDLQLDGGRSIRGTFDASWRQRTMLCG
jgi:hypothetical protein